MAALISSRSSGSSSSGFSSVKEVSPKMDFESIEKVISTHLTSDDHSVPARDPSSLIRYPTKEVPRFILPGLFSTIDSFPRTSQLSPDCQFKTAIGVFKPFDSAAKTRFEKFDPIQFDLPLLPPDLHLKNLQYLKDLKNIYYFSNECGQKETLEKLKSFPSISQGAYIGFSGLFNFDVIVARKPEIAFICDISPIVLKFFSIVRMCVLKATDRKEFIDILLENLEKRGMFDDSIKDYLPADVPKKDALRTYFINQLENENSWLYSDESFMIIKRLYENNKLYHLALNAIDTQDNFRILSNWFAANGYKLDTLYISNIFDWIKKSDSKQSDFVKNMFSIKTKETIIIDARKPLKCDGSKKHSLHQRCTIGTLPIFF